MSTIWILILFFDVYHGGGVTAAEFTNEKACRAAIVSASLTGSGTNGNRVKAVCVAKEIK